MFKDNKDTVECIRLNSRKQKSERKKPKKEMYSQQDGGTFQFYTG